MSTVVAGALAVTPLYATPADALVLWDDPGATWRSLGTIPVGGGTVTSVAAGTGITVSPSPITGAGTVSLTVPVSVANGGTGATTGAGALTSLGAITQVTAGTGLTGGGTTGTVTLSLTAPVTVANGGTGTATVFTAGSVLFAGASGVHAQDNANLFWDDGANRLGVGTAAPASKLHVAQSSAYNDITTATLRLSDTTTPAKSLFAGYDITLGTNGRGFIQTIYSGVAFTDLLLNPNGGNVGIGTASPANKFQVNLAANRNVCVSYVNSVAQIIGINDTNNAYHALYIDAVDLALCSYSGGNVIIGAGGAVARLSAYGTTANSSGAWLVISGRELKQDIVPYTRGLEAITALNPVMFRYRADTPFARSADDPGEPLIGLIADEVAPHVPEVVGKTTATIGKDEAAREAAVATLEPGNLIYCVINAIKTIAERLDRLDAVLSLSKENPV